MRRARAGSLIVFMTCLATGARPQEPSLDLRGENFLRVLSQVTGR